MGLGTDSLSSNDSLDMFAEMRAALAASRARASRGAPPEGAGSLDDATGEAPALALTANDVLRMATLEGARALGWEDLIGSLEKGKRADLISVRLPGPSTDADADPDGRSGWADPVESLVAQATASDVGMVMVEGQMVFENIRMEASEAAPGSTIIGDTFAAVRAKLRL